MGGKQKQGGKKSKAGRAGHKPTAVRYKSNMRRKANKLKKILQSNGEHAWKQYQAGTKVFTKVKKIVKEA